MKQILISIFTFLSLNIYAQVCFTYDDAGNRIKRQACFVAITNQDERELAQVSPDLATELRVLSDSRYFSKLVVYPNPTASAFYLNDQHEWRGSSLTFYTNTGEILQAVVISDDPIDVSSLPSGSYFLILSNQAIRKTAKLLITK